MILHSQTWLIMFLEIVLLGIFCQNPNPKGEWGREFMYLSAVLIIHGPKHYTFCYGWAIEAIAIVTSL